MEHPRFAAVFAYFDESGKFQDSDFICIAGFISDDARWNVFAEQWDQLLKTYRIPALHMRHVMPLKGPFDGWDREQAKKMLGEFIDSRAEYEAHVDRIWDENYERTLGQLLRSLRQSGFAIPTTLDSLLRESLEKRNYLVHSYFRERAKDWFTPEGRRSMAAELKSMQELFRKADHALHDVTSKMYSAIGVTEEKLTAIADLMLADANDEEIDKGLSKK